MDAAVYSRIRQLLGEISQLQQELVAIRTDPSISLSQLKGELDQLAGVVEQEAQQAISHALQQINLRDDGYIFIRAIDGDTIEAEPPGELREWMIDVHVRLYGIDAPERKEPGWNRYKEVLETLCRASLSGPLFCRL